ncbi:MAG: hypothetical protein ACRDY2_12560 [Acidimicrobiales bacterium]
MLPPETYSQRTPWDQDKWLDDWVLDRVLELTYTAWDLERFALDLGYDGPPFRWDDQRRALREPSWTPATSTSTASSATTWATSATPSPSSKRKDIAAHGEFRTQRLILQIYDAMSKAIESTEPYTTVLDPSPSDPSVAHPDTNRATAAR